MFFYLLIATFVVAAATCAIVVSFFNRPIRVMLDRIIDDPISAAWNRYITFAAVVVGISGGVRIYSLERYIMPFNDVDDDTSRQALTLTSERWTLEIYRTVIESLQSMAWMYLAVFLFALMAYVITRISERKTQQR